MSPGCANSRAPRGPQLDRGRRLRRLARWRSDPSQQFGKAVGIDRLQEIVDGVDGERLHGVLGMGGDEDHDRRAVQAGEQFKSVGAAELDIEEHEFRLRRHDRSTGGRRAVCLRDDIDRPMRRQQAAHRRPREGFIIDDQDPHGSPLQHEGGDDPVVRVRRARTGGDLGADPEIAEAPGRRTRWRSGSAAGRPPGAVDHSGTVSPSTVADRETGAPRPSSPSRARARR